MENLQREEMDDRHYNGKRVSYSRQSDLTHPRKSRMKVDGGHHSQPVFQVHHLAARCPLY